MPRAPTVRVSVGFGTDRWQDHAPQHDVPHQASSSSSAAQWGELADAFATIARLQRKVSRLRRERDDALAMAKPPTRGACDHTRLRRLIKRALRRAHPDKQAAITNAEMTLLLTELLEHVP